MGTPLRERIASELELTQFNIPLVVDRTGASETYVKRVADDIRPVTVLSNRMPPTGSASLTQPASIAPPEQAVDDFLASIIPQNQEAFLQLREATYNQLIQMVGSENSLPPSLLIRILRLILEHEAQLRAIARPIAAVSVDQRSVTYNIQSLVQRMDQMPLEELRGLVPVPKSLPPAGDIIDG